MTFLYDWRHVTHTELSFDVSSCTLNTEWAAPLICPINTHRSWNCLYFPISHSWILFLPHRRRFPDHLLSGILQHKTFTCLRTYVCMYVAVYYTYSNYDTTLQYLVLMFVAESCVSSVLELLSMNQCIHLLVWFFHPNPMCRILDPCLPALTSPCLCA